MRKPTSSRLKMKRNSIQKALNPFMPSVRFSDTFYEIFCTQATLLIINQFHSNLRSREKTELVYL